MKRSHFEWLTMTALSGSPIKPPALPEVLTLVKLTMRDPKGGSSLGCSLLTAIPKYRKVKGTSAFTERV
jgi:hypothetical protein